MTTDADKRRAAVLILEAHSPCPICVLRGPRACPIADPVMTAALARELVEAHGAVSREWTYGAAWCAEGRK